MGDRHAGIRREASRRRASCRTRPLSVPDGRATVWGRLDGLEL
jgi:hypothetical protein